MRCSGVCKVENGVRLFHFVLTFFIFYLLLTNRDSDLNSAWNSRNYGYVISVVVLLCVSCILYLIASVLDPGYLPKVDPLTLVSTLPDVPLPPTTPTTLAGDDTQLSMPSDSDNHVDSPSSEYCRICHHKKPLRTKHCYVCGRCVRRFDHHCPWLGNCIGERNHRWFWMFLTVETALLAWGVCISWSAIAHYDSMAEWLRLNSLVCVSLVVTFVSVIIVGLLFLYHTYLMLTGQTTWEQVSAHRIPYLSNELANPFNEGYCCNVIKFVCLMKTRDWNQVYQKRISSR